MPAPAKSHDPAPQRLPTRAVFCLLALMLAAAIVLAAGSGYVNIPFWDVIRIIAAKVAGNDGLIAHLDPLAPVVVMDVRLPRILAAALMGGGLAVSGAVFQGILLNPLADPYTLGVSAGAAFGASLALLLNFTLLGLWLVPVFTFMAVIYLTAGSGDLSSGSLILSGIIVAAILSAGVSFIKYLADDAVRTLDPRLLVLRPPSLVAGIGCNRGTALAEIRDLLDLALSKHDLARGSLCALASVDLKADEAGLCDLAAEMDLPIRFFTREELSRVEAVPTPSALVSKHIGVPNVCEAAAILAGRNGPRDSRLIVPKQIGQNVTVAIARRGCMSSV
jgi:hypothetical protein